MKSPCLNCSDRLPNNECIGDCEKLSKFQCLIIASQDLTFKCNFEDVSFNSMGFEDNRLIRKGGS